MPIMDGYEACQHIYAFLNDLSHFSSASLSITERQSSTLIYCLSGEDSPEALQNIARYPFDGRIENLNTEEIQNLLQKIEHQNI